MLELRIKDNAFIRLIKKWLKAGVLETDGRVEHPLTGSPQADHIADIGKYLHALCTGIMV